MTFRLGRRNARPPSPSTKLTFRAGDTLLDTQGERFVIGYRDDEQRYLILRPEGAPKNAANIRYLTYDELNTSWSHLPREEVSTMARSSVPTPPKMTRAEWLKRTKTRVSLTKAELEQLAQLIAAGHVLLRDAASVSPKLKAAMSRLGINTKGI